MLNESKIIIISAPSGAGKSTLLSMMKQNDADIGYPISHTTRQKRVNEENGKNYHFICESEFQQLKESGYFVESALIYGYHYGTSYESINKLLMLKSYVLLEIDWQGARLIRERFENSTSIFIMPPNFLTLKERLLSRNLDSQASINKRLSEAKEDMEKWVEYDYAVVNDDLNACYDGLMQIIFNQDSSFLISNPIVINKMNNAIS
jgi:guanylate kinase